MSLISQAMQVLFDEDKFQEALAVQRIMAAVETLFGIAQGVEDQLPREILDAINTVMEELDRGEEVGLPPAADDPMPLPKVIKGPPTGVRGHPGGRARPRLTIVKGGKE